MMSEFEIREWRVKEKERLGSLIMDSSKDRCRLVIYVLNEILRDD